jgi:hypothetical protein
MLIPEHIPRNRQVDAISCLSALPLSGKASGIAETTANNIHKMIFPIKALPFKIIYCLKA